MSWRSALPRIGVNESSERAPAELAALLAAAGERVAALELYRKLVQASPDDRDLLAPLAVLLGRLGRDEEGLAFEREWLSSTWRK